MNRLLDGSIRRLLSLIVVIVVSGCTDLEVTNLNQPDRSRALAEADAIEALIGGTFGVFFNMMHTSSNVVALFPLVATEFSGVPTTGGGWRMSIEPRGVLENHPALSALSALGAPQAWAGFNQIASSIHDGLRTIEERNLTIEDNGEDVTPRARAYAKLMQGLAWGYLAMIWDQAPIIPETEPLQSDIVPQVVAALRPWEEVKDEAIKSLDEAIAIAQQNNFTIPPFSASRVFFATPDAMSSADFVALASTMAARILVLSARNPQQRAQVDWNRVLQYTEAGLTQDFQPVLAAGFRSSTLYSRIETASAGCANCYRWDNRVIGPSDVSGKYQDWIETPIEERDRFDIETPDRRITGATPTSAGAYTRYWEHDNGFPAARGLYFRTGYQWARHVHAGFNANSGSVRMATVDENNLLRAEALIYTNRLTEAADLINITRTREHTLPDGLTYDGLPAVTESGVPQGPNCVPRTDAGACGDLMVALRYERMIEMAATDAFRGYLDSRGFGLLPEGTFLHAAIPGDELVLLDLPLYAFGGVGTEWGAVYAPVTMQNVP